MTETKKETSGRKAMIFALAALPIAAIAIYFVVGAMSDTPLSSSSVLERWPGGAEKLLFRDWREGKDNFEEYCYKGPKGKDWGCGIKKNDRHHNGIFIEWYWFDPSDSSPNSGKGIPRYTRTFKDGKSNGIWRTYFKNGDLSSEILFKNGQRVEWKVFNAMGKIIGEGRSNPEQLKASAKELADGD